MDNDNLALILYIAVPAVIETFSSKNLNLPRHDKAVRQLECIVSGSNITSVHWRTTQPIQHGIMYNITQSYVFGQYAYGQNMAVSSKLAFTTSDVNFTCDNITNFDGVYYCEASYTQYGETKMVAQVVDGFKLQGQISIRISR